jgi:hypothetical protein
MPHDVCITPLLERRSIAASTIADTAAATLDERWLLLSRDPQELWRREERGGRAMCGPQHYKLRNTTPHLLHCVKELVKEAILLLRVEQDLA